MRDTMVNKVVHRSKPSDLQLLDQSDRKIAFIYSAVGDINMSTWAVLEKMMQVSI